MHGRLRWDVRLTEAHGIDNYPFGSTSVDLRCEGRASAKDEPNVTIHSPCPIEAEIVWDGGRKIVSVQQAAPSIA